MTATINQTILNRVEATIETIRPFLKVDGGDVELVEITTDMVVKLRFLGNCKCCSMSEMTMKVGLEEAIKSAIPVINEVEAVK